MIYSGIILKTATDPYGLVAVLFYLETNSI